MIMNQLIKICDAFDIRFLQIKYNDDEGDACTPVSAEEHSKSTTRHIVVNGMTCSACSLAITQQLEALNGVHRASVSLVLARATVSYDASVISATELARSVQQAGYDTTLEEMNEFGTIERLNQTQEFHHLRQAISSASFCSTIIACLEYMPAFIQLSGITLYLTSPWAWMALVLAFRVQVSSAWQIHRRAWTSGVRKLTMDTLLSLSLLLGLGLATLQALLRREQNSIAYTSSGSFLTIVILAGRYLEAILKRESHRNLAMLYELQAGKEMYRLVGSEVTVPASLLRKGDHSLVWPQASIPCDCCILEGSSAINESTITGESMPVVKTVGDFLFAGTRNLSRQICVIIAQDQSESALAKVIEGVSEATEQRLQGIEPLDAIMSYFVSGVVLLAVAAFIATFWNLRSQPPVSAFTVACERAATVLAAACPCGIGLAIPSAAMAGIDIAYSKGVLLSGGIRTMQALFNTTHVVMDKTGTLTQGRLEVVEHHFSEDLRLNRQLCYRLLAAAEFEEARVHPVGKAVFKWALLQAQPAKSDKAVAPTRNMQRTLGMGVSCEVRGHSNEWIPVHIGRASFLSSHNISVPVSNLDQAPEASKIHFAISLTYAGNILLHDTLRPSAPSVVSTLLHSGRDVTMLTGDTAIEATRISSSLGIRVLGSRTLPQDKVSHIRNLQNGGHHIAMVGDGINDAPAQGAADVRISISLAQGCLAGVGSVVILSNDLNALLDLFEMAKKVVRQAKLNVGWALVYNVFALSLAVGVWERWGWSVGPKGAGIMMAGSSASVLSMSLWLRWTLGRHSSRRSELDMRNTANRNREEAKHSIH